MRRRLGRLTIAAVACAMLAAGTPACAEKITLRLADGIPSGHIIDRLIIEPFIKAVSEKSGGQIVIQHFPAEQLGKSRDLLMMTQAGAADISFIVPSYMSDHMPLSTVTELPGIFQNTCQGNAALRALTSDGAILDAKEFEPNGIKPLIVFLMPPYQLLLSSHRKLDGIGDVDGLKIRTPGGAMDLTVLGMHAVPIRVAPSEIYESMSRGTLDGALLAYQSATSYHLTGMIRSGTLAQDFGTVTISFSIGLKRWNALPESARNILEEAGRRLSEQACGAFDKAEADAIDKMRPAGTRLIELNEADRATLAATFDAVRKDWAERLDRRGKAGSAVVAAFRAAAAAASQ